MGFFKSKYRDQLEEDLKWEQTYKYTAAHQPSLYQHNSNFSNNGQEMSTFQKHLPQSSTLWQSESINLLLKCSCTALGFALSGKYNGGVGRPLALNSWFCWQDLSGCGRWKSVWFSLPRSNCPTDGASIPNLGHNFYYAQMASRVTGRLATNSCV